MVFIEDTHKAGGGALVVHHGRLESGNLHVGQMVSCIPPSWCCLCKLHDLLTHSVPSLYVKCVNTHHILSGMFTGEEGPNAIVDQVLVDSALASGCCCPSLPCLNLPP